MQVTATVAGLAEAGADARRGLVARVMAAMRHGGYGLREELRDQVEAAGLGPRLAKTWKLIVYPEGGKGSLEPAALVSSKAPKIMDAFARGATIGPVNGKRFLALPTPECPRKRNKQAMTPHEVEQRYGRKLVVVMADAKGMAGHRGDAAGYLVMNGLVARKVTGRWRNASARQIERHARLPGKAAPVHSVVMFTLQRRVKMPRALDLASAASHWGTTVARLIESGGDE